MQQWIDAILELPPTDAPVDDLLAVSLGQSRGSRAPEPDWRRAPTASTASTQDLWEHLGDFA
jgi:hypothetical protein